MTDCSISTRRNISRVFSHVRACVPSTCKGGLVNSVVYTDFIYFTCLCAFIFIAGNLLLCPGCPRLVDLHCRQLHCVYPVNLRDLRTVETWELIPMLRYATRLAEFNRPVDARAKYG